MFENGFRNLLAILLFSVLFSISTQAQVESKTDKNTQVKPKKDKNNPPIIIIPGLTGSELINTKTGKTVWFKPQRDKDDDLRLPVSPNLSKNRDSLVVGDIIRNIKLVKFLPEAEIYERLIDGLEKRGNYQEGNWSAPAKNGFKNTFYVFAYDWRLDNVENARILVQKVEALKRKLGKPNLKFNIIAHSMGGLISRYAARYGNADLPAGNAPIKPTWAGAKNFDRIFLLGTPNEGSPTALDSLVNGYSIFGSLNLPFVQNLSNVDSFTIPSAYQLLPFQGSFKAFDENLQPLDIDIYDPKVWDKYNWSVFDDKEFSKKLKPEEQRAARDYFNVVLNRAKRFHQALSSESSGKIPVSFYLIGGDCKDTLNAVVLIEDKKKNRWRTLFKEDSFERADGTKVSAEEVKKVMFAPGDGVVPKRSLTMETLSQNGKQIMPVTSNIFLCEGHTKLVTNVEVQDKIFALLFGSTPEAETKATR